jgi:hypothetical protein
VGLEDRQDLLGRKSGRMTTHYSATEIGNLLAAVSRIANSPAKLPRAQCCASSGNA